MPDRRGSISSCMMSFLCFFIFILLLDESLGYGSGAPDMTYYCDTLSPGHPASEDPSLPLFVSANKIGNNQYTVRIRTEDKPFKGFLLKAFPVNDNDTLLGNFTVIPGDAKLACSDQGITHTNNDTKNERVFTYTTDTVFQGDVEFKAAIVTSYRENWKLASSLEQSGVPVSTTPGPPGNIAIDPECEKTKGCYSQCTDNRCQYQITWQKQGDFVRFEMLKDITSIRMVSDTYHSIAFSDDDKMGSDHVLMCVVSNGVGRIEVGQNLPNTKSYVRYPDANLGISSVSATVDGTVLNCSFDRVINSTDPDIVSLTRTWRLLYATGPVSGNSPIKHNMARVSSGRVDFLSTARVSASDPDNTVVKIHGSLMIIAWMFFSSIGIVTARYYKSEWPDRTLQKQKVWFQIHRSSMVMVVIFTCISFILIFVELEGYQKVIVADDRTYLESHPILGIVVTCLTLINPIMALFRCAPTDKRRTIFNIAHFTVGSGAHALSAITIVFGMSLDKANVTATATYVMYAYIATFIVLEIALEIWRYRESFQDKNAQCKNEISLNDTTGHGSSNVDMFDNQKKRGRKVLLLYFHVITMLAYTVTLTVLVMQNE